MRWESLVSTQNLKLAWRRINTGLNLQYKRFFRESYLVYESSLDSHIGELHKKLKSKAWEPSHATRVYLPKESGLQRPLSLLEIEDQIILQAIANLFAKKLYEKRKKVELKTVFSNKLASHKDSIFFVERWQKTYGIFQRRCIKAFNQGYNWAADFDLAAYYDTISHDLLLTIVSPQNSNPDVVNAIKDWLHVWSADKKEVMTGHGIPQGPIASNFLAESFFLPIDLKLQKTSFKYFRYVDDIRLFGRSENEVREAVIKLEQECRHRGLIPQSSKLNIRRLTSIEDAMGSLPSIPPTRDWSPSEQNMPIEKATIILRTSLEGRPQKVKDKARFRYVMYRAPEDTEFLKVVRRLLPRHPEHIDAFVAYFGNFTRRPIIAKAALDCLRNGMPYSYVRGELWHLVARFGNSEIMQQRLRLARDDARQRHRCIALSWGVMHFLMKCEEEGIMSIGRRMDAEDPISRSLLAPLFKEQEFINSGRVITLLKGTLMEQLAGVRELQRRRVPLKSLGIRQTELAPACREALKSLGVINRHYRRTSQDWIGETLCSFYKCKKNVIWRELLGPEYEHACQILMEAKDRFNGPYSDWLSLQDSFNDIVIRKYFDFCNIRGIGGYSKTEGKDKKLVRYGILIAEGNRFNVTHQSEAEALRIIHNRRNRLPGSHPYDEKGGSQNKWLTKGERNSLVRHVRIALDGIAMNVSKNLSK